MKLLPEKSSASVIMPMLYLAQAARVDPYLESYLFARFSISGDREVELTRRCELSLVEMQRAIGETIDGFTRTVNRKKYTIEGGAYLSVTLGCWVLENGEDMVSRTIDIGIGDWIEDLNPVDLRAVCLLLVIKARPIFLESLAAQSITLTDAEAA